MVRFHPQWRRAREIVHAGAIGEVGAIQTLFTYRLLDPQNIRNRPPGGGGLYDIGCYAILKRDLFSAPSRPASPPASMSIRSLAQIALPARL